MCASVAAPGTTPLPQATLCQKDAYGLFFENTISFICDCARRQMSSMQNYVEKQAPNTPDCMQGQMPSTQNYMHGQMFANVGAYVVMTMITRDKQRGLNIYCDVNCSVP